MNEFDPKVKAAIDQARDVFAGVKDGMQALDYLVEVLKVAPAAAAPVETQVLVKLAVEVDTSQIDATQVKIDQLRAGLADIGYFEYRTQVVDTLHQLAKQNEAVVEMLSQLLKELESFHARSKLQFSGPRFE